MRLLTPNTDFYNTFHDKERYLLAWRMSIVFSTVFFILSSIYFIQGVDAIVPVTITFLVSFFSIIYLYKSKNYTVLYWWYAITGTVMANFAMNYVMTSTHYVDFIWMMTCVLIAFIGLGRKVAIVFIVTNILGAGYFYFFTLNKLLETIQPKDYLGLFGEYFEMLFAFFVVTYLMFKFAQFQNISEKQLKFAHKKNVEKTNENEVLIKEIHHRVKNNLQIIISLLRLQKNEIKSDEAKIHFTEAINRIMVMSLIHQKLYNDKSLANINIKSYLVELTNDILALATIGKKIEIEVNSDIDKIGLKTIVPLGLLVNELVSNSIQHAFINKVKGKIIISISSIDEQAFQLIYFDNGIWKDYGEDYRSFGLELIGILASQLEGDYVKNADIDGTNYTFNLKNIDLVN